MKTENEKVPPISEILNSVEYGDARKSITLDLPKTTTVNLFDTGNQPGYITSTTEQYQSFPGTGVTICLLRTPDGSYVTGESFNEFNDLIARHASKANALYKLSLITQYMGQRGRPGF